MINRRTKIQEYIKVHSEEVISSGNIDDNGIEAESISYDLKIDRANVSRELNNLWKDGLLIKIAGRPVFYLDSEVIANAFPDAYVPSFIPKENCLSDYINITNTYKSPYDNSLDLSNMIGANGSLSSAIQKAKAAISYPPYGLHTLITGNSGTEKSTLADSMVEYAIHNGIRNKKCPYYDIDCRRANADVSQFERKLFGYQDEYDTNHSSKGILEMCTNGFLLLQNIDYLPQSTADLLLSLLNKGYFTRINSNSKIPVKFMMILISALPLTDKKLLPYTHYITTNISLPDIDERGTYEKLIMIMDCFAREARNIKKPIIVTKDVISAYAYRIYPENITKMENEIRDACSRAFVENRGKDEKIKVNISHLPEEVANNKDINKKVVAELPQYLKIINEDYLLYDSNGHSNEFDHFTNYSHNSIERISRLINSKPQDNSLETKEKWIEEIVNEIKKCNFNQLQEINTHINLPAKIIINDILFKNPAYSLLKRQPELLYGLYLEISDYLLRNDTDDNEPIIDKYPLQLQNAKEISEKFNKQLGTTLNNNELNFITIYLAIVTKFIGTHKETIIVAAHGKHVASEMVDYVKDNLPEDINMVAFDYDPEQSIDEFNKSVLNWINSNDKSEIILLVDRQPLTSLKEYLKEKINIDCKLISGLSLNKLFDLSNTLSLNHSGNDEIEIHGSSDINEDTDYIKTIFKTNLKNELLFIDTDKAIDILSHCLKSILTRLGIDYNRQLGLIYYENGLYMLERVIKNEPLQNKKLYKFISENHELMETISKGLEFANNALQIRIPQAEYAHIAQLLLPFIEA